MCKNFFSTDLFRKEDVSENGCCRERKFLYEMNEGYKVSCTKLLQGRYLSKILQSSSTVKISLKSGKKVDVSKNLCDVERDFISEMKEACKVSCVKMLF